VRSGGVRGAADGRVLAPLLNFLLLFQRKGP
jgi:hypothetical protein